MTTNIVVTHGFDAIETTQMRDTGVLNRHGELIHLMDFGAFRDTFDAFARCEARVFLPVERPGARYEEVVL